MLADELGVVLGRLYIMDQQTKWGNCSALGNLSFNWRLVMGPDYVLRYLVTHEVVHLAVPRPLPQVLADRSEPLPSRGVRYRGLAGEAGA